MNKCKHCGSTNLNDFGECMDCGYILNGIPYKEEMVKLYRQLVGEWDIDIVP